MCYSTRADATAVAVKTKSTENATRLCTKKSDTSCSGISLLHMEVQALVILTFLYRKLFWEEVIYDSIILSTASYSAATLGMVGISVNIQD